MVIMSLHPGKDGYRVSPEPHYILADNSYCISIDMKDGDVTLHGLTSDSMRELGQAICRLAEMAAGHAEARARQAAGGDPRSIMEIAADMKALADKGDRLAKEGA